jgi:hypothetical protein
LPKKDEFVRLRLLRIPAERRANAVTPLCAMKKVFRLRLGIGALIACECLLGGQAALPRSQDKGLPHRIMNTINTRQPGIQFLPASVRKSWTRGLIIKQWDYCERRPSAVRTMMYCHEIHANWKCASVRP